MAAEVPAGPPPITIISNDFGSLSLTELSLPYFSSSLDNSAPSSPLPT